MTTDASNPPVADVEFFWDPVCPFAWQTSRWLRRVADLRDLTVDWRFINLSILNEERDYDAEFPEGYRESHDRGRRMLRVAAAIRAAEGRDAMDGLYPGLRSHHLAPRRRGGHRLSGQCRDG